MILLVYIFKYKSERFHLYLFLVIISLDYIKKIYSY